jgi:hypothetical protein
MSRDAYLITIPAGDVTTAEIPTPFSTKLHRTALSKAQASFHRGFELVKSNLRQNLPGLAILSRFFS